ncbi:tetratricopeptide repeat protein [Pseudobutyrivibrio sp.]|uniref:tetratricopeptide repeat protein n=1 Tax=Pseudobutyrivibrio sp. TaxID=2014367 RepID=UPI001DC457F2|nr:tetratricopeptide repeat protein [Pseudobutyrivibrio sp.]MBE5909915.1 tetratricopeptide repeat protein [Pseudobutyrivibrio sp.]
MDSAYLNEGNIPENKKKNNKKLIIIVAIVLLALIVGGIFLFGGKGKKLEHYLDLGDKYLDEANFDEALAAYDKALEIDDMCVEAYLGKIEVLIRTEKFDEALEVAKEGYDKTGDERLAEKIEMLESGNISDSDGRIYKETFYDEDGSILGYCENTYDYEHDGRVSSVTRYNPNGSLDQTIEYKYDENGNAIVSSGASGEEHYLTLIESEYSNDLMTYSKWTYHDGQVSETNYFYDDNLCVKEVQNHLGFENERYTETIYIEYDNDENVVKRTGENENGDIQWSITYSYDKEGNMTESCSYNRNYDSGEGELVFSGRIVYSYDGDICTGYIKYDADGNVIGSVDYQ